MIDGVYTILDRIDELKKRFGLTAKTAENTGTTESTIAKETFSVPEIEAVNTPLQMQSIAQPKTIPSVRQSEVSSIINTITEDKTGADAFVSSLNQMNRSMVESALKSYKASEKSAQTSINQIDTVK